MRKHLFLTTCLLISILQLVSCYPSYDQYLVQYNKTRTPQQYAIRKKIYDDKIQSFKLITTYTAGVNQYTDWTPQQIHSLSTLQVLPEQTRVGENPPTKLSSARLGAPATLDWRTRNAVTSVKSQGSCGACWAFASCAYAQSKMIIQGKYTKDNIDLSEQYVLKCTTDSACDGGYLENAIQTVKNVPTQQQYPYNPYGIYNPAICLVPGIQTGYKHYNYYSLSDQQLIDLLQTGPIAISIASSGWTNYVAGTFNCSSSATVDHAVLLVGYTQSQWIVKNQWNTNWGQQGYIRVTRDRAANCKIGYSAHVLSSLNFKLYIWVVLFFIALILL